MALVSTRDETADVALEMGVLSGRRSGDVLVFQGIPYASPPVGALRWRPPAPAVPWTGIRDASSPGSPSLQMDAFTGACVGEEDCLYLNVTTPTLDGSLPVMVWLHGGGYTQGYGSEYNATILAHDGQVVVVTINYRLGWLGLLVHPALEDPSAGRISGDCALEDQRAALRWVQANIGAFGGDPNNVTLFGESAGGSAVLCQMASPAADGLFHRAIAQSPLVVGTLPSLAFGGESSMPRETCPSFDQATERGHRLVAALDLDEGPDLARRLRELPAETFLQADLGKVGTPAWGGGMPRSIEDALSEGTFMRVPLMLGNTQDEHSFFVFMIYNLPERLGVNGLGPFTPANYSVRITEMFGEQAAEISAAYSLTTFGSPTTAFSTALTDLIWALPNEFVARTASTHAPVYLYQFADESAGPGFISSIPHRDGFPFRAYHGSDIPYIFGRMNDGWNADDFAPAQRELSQKMISYWSRFAAAGNPNEGALPPWPEFSADGRAQRLSTGKAGISAIDFAAAHNLAFWKSLTPTLSGGETTAEAGTTART